VRRMLASLLEAIEASMDKQERTKAAALAKG